MLIKVEVIGESSNAYQRKTGQKVNDLVLACLDRDSSGFRLKNTFDFIIPEDEKGPFAGKVNGKVVELAIVDMEVFSGRLRARGHVQAIADATGKLVPVNGVKVA